MSDFDKAEHFRDIKNYNDMKESYLKCGSGYSIACLGEYYQNIQDYENMKKYYCIAIKKGIVWAMINIGWYYQFIEKDYKLMKKYYAMAIFQDKSGPYDILTEEDTCLAALDHLIDYYTNIEKNEHLVNKYILLKKSKTIEKETI